MLTPELNDDDEEKAVGRARYLRNKGRGKFNVFTAPDGSLWVTRRS